MEENDLFKVILFSHPRISNVLLFIVNESLFILGYLKNKVTIAQIDKVDALANKEPAEFTGEILLHDRNIILIVYFNSIYYGIDEEGWLFTIQQDMSSGEIVEYDIFEDSPSQPEKWCIRTLMQVTHKSTVINASLGENGHLALLTISEDVSLVLVDVSSGQLLKSIVVQNAGLFKSITKNECLLEWIPKQKIAADFYLKWFKEAKEKNGFFLITLPNGRILAVFPDSGKVECLYIWCAPFVANHWSYSPDSGSCSLTLVSAFGGIIKLTEMGEIISIYLPAKVLKTVLFSEEGLFFSDYNDSYWKDLASFQPSISLPLKGIICWGRCELFTLAFSKYGDVYVVSKNSGISEEIEELPDSCLSALLIKEHSIFEEVSTELEKTEKYLEAIILAKKTINFSLNCQIISVRSGISSFCLVVKCLTEGVQVDSLDWLLSICLTVGDKTLCSVHKLSNNLDYLKPVTQFFSFSFGLDRVFHMKLHAFLSFSPGTESTTYLPIINLGKVELDPSYFLLPASELETDYIPKETSLNILLEKIDSSNLCDKEDTILSVKLSENSPEKSVFENLLRNSKPLWRTSLWKEAITGKNLELGLIGKLVRFEVGNGVVTISGSDPIACSVAKKILIMSSLTKCRSKANCLKILHHLQELSASVEVLQHEECESSKKLEYLKVLLEQKVTSRLLI